MPKNSKSYTFYTLHIPVLFFILALTLVLSFVMRPKEDTAAVELPYAMIHEEEVLGSNTSIISEGGKTSEVTKEVVGDRVIIRMKIYDSSGNLKREKVTENPVKPTQNEKIEKISPRIPERPESTETPGQRELPANTFSRFPIRVNEETGAFYIQTRERMVELGAMPDSIAEKAIADGSLDEIGNVRIDSVDDRDPVFIVEGTRQRRFLRMFPVRVNVRETYDVETSEKNTMELVSFRDKVINFLSF